MNDSEQTKINSWFRALEMSVGAVAGIVFWNIGFGMAEGRSLLRIILSAVGLIASILAFRWISDVIQAKKLSLLQPGQPESAVGDGGSRPDA